MTRPTNIFKWSILDTDGDGNPLKSYPPSEVYQTGLLAGEPWARLWHNQAMSDFSEWIQHLAGISTDGGAEPIGTIKMALTSANVDPAALWGGTWATTTDTIGGNATDVFRKTHL